MASKAGIRGALLLCLTASGAAAQGSTEEPFAVLSRGRPLPHVERTVVVLSDSAAPAAPADSVRAPARAAATPAATPPPTTATSTPPPASGSRASATRPPAARSGASRTTAAPRTHTVAWGDTWYGIALEYDVSSSSLRAANPDVDPERLRSGMVLRIPSGPGTARAPAATSAGARTASAPARRTHKVEAGESLWGIGRRYGVSAAAIREANDLEDDRVRIGETLVIPQED